MKHTLYLTPKVFSLWGKFIVQNEKRTTVYTIEGERSFLNRTIIYNLKNEPAGEIHLKIPALRPTFKFEINGYPTGTITARYSIPPKFDISCYGWHIEGDPLGVIFDVFDLPNHLIARIDKEPFQIKDHYAIYYENKKDEIPLLLLTLAIQTIYATRSFSLWTLFSSW